MVIHDADVFSGGKQAITEIAASSQHSEPAFPLSGDVTWPQLHPASDTGPSQSPVVFPHLTTDMKPHCASGWSAAPRGRRSYRAWRWNVFPARDCELQIPSAGLGKGDEESLHVHVGLQSWLSKGPFQTSSAADQAPKCWYLPHLAAPAYWNPYSNSVRKKKWCNCH